MAAKKKKKNAKLETVNGEPFQEETLTKEMREHILAQIQKLRESQGGRIGIGYLIYGLQALHNLTEIQKSEITDVQKFLELRHKADEQKIQELFATLISNTRSEFWLAS